MQPTNLIAAASVADLAERAGRLLLEHFGHLDPAALGRKSSARDLVTAADLAAERLIVAELRAAWPDSTIQAEEETDDPDDPDRLRWYVDPLDGTVNFVHGLPAFCVSIGAYLGARPVLAAVHAPLLRETYYAAAGAGAWLRSTDSPEGAVSAGAEPRRMRVSETAELSEAVVATGFPYRRGELPNDNLGNLHRLFTRVRGLRRMGSAALDLALVAAGRLDAFWELHLGAHDCAAGALLVREAGGLVTDCSGGDNWLHAGELVGGPAPLARALLQHVSAAPDPAPAWPRPT